MNSLKLLGASKGISSLRTITTRSHNINNNQSWSNLKSSLSTQHYFSRNQSLNNLSITSSVISSQSIQSKYYYDYNQGRLESVRSITNSSKSGGNNRTGYKKDDPSTTLVVENYDVITTFSFEVDQFVKKGDKLYSEAKYPMAIEQYQQGLSKTIDRIECALLFWRIAACHFRTGKVTDALNFFNKASNLIPYSHDDCYKILAQGASILEFQFDQIEEKEKEKPEPQLQLEKVIRAWEEVVKANPEKPDGYVGIGRCMLKSNNPRIVECMHYSMKAMSCGYHHPPLQTFSSEILVIDNKEQLALKLLNLFFDEYIEFYTNSKIYRLDMNTLGNNYFRRGLCHLYVQQHTNAANDFTNAIKFLSSNEHPSIKFYRGRALAAIKKYKESLEDYTECIKFNPTFIRAYEERSEVYKQLGMKDLAERDYNVYMADKMKRKQQREESVKLYKEERIELLKKREAALQRQNLRESNMEKETIVNNKPKKPSPYSKLISKRLQEFENGTLK